MKLFCRRRGDHQGCQVRVLLSAFFATISFELLFGSSTRRCHGVTGVWALATPTPGAGALKMPPLARTAEHLPLAHKAMEYIDRSTDPFHAVQTSIDLLSAAGFQELQDSDNYVNQLQKGGLYYFTRNKSTLVAFAIGKQLNVQKNFGFKVIGGHTDSPNLRVKPRSKRTSGGGKCTQIGVECYGGGLWHTWFDRDLGLSGRVMVRNTETGKIEQKLVQINRALLRISNLAIHLQETKEREAFKINKEDHLSPILAMQVQKALTDGGSSSSSGGGDSDINNNNNQADEKKPEINGDDSSSSVKDGWAEYQEPALLQILAHELSCEVNQIVDFELSLFDIQKAALGGAFSEFLYSARLDNLASCFLAVQALLDHVAPTTAAGETSTVSNSLLEQDQDISMIVLYDHEEVGSNSAVGAGSPIMGESIRRIAAALTQQQQREQQQQQDDTGKTARSILSVPEIFNTCIRRSFVVSSDQAHAVHPNYASKHEKSHQPIMNQGMVIKRNSSQRYATNTVTGLVMREIARRAGLPPVQEFLVRQDCGCGSTIGPLISTATGIRAVDMGCPQLSMHSIRETMGVCDLTHGLALFKAFFQHFRHVDESIEQ